MSLDTLGRGGSVAHESLILQTWTDWYLNAIRAATDIEVGGTTPGTIEAIEAAARRVERAGGERVARFAGRGGPYE